MRSSVTMGTFQKKMAENMKVPNKTIDLSLGEGNCIWHVMAPGDDDESVNFYLLVGTAEDILVWAPPGSKYEVKDVIDIRELARSRQRDQILKRVRELEMQHRQREQELKRLQSQLNSLESTETNNTQSMPKITFPALKVNFASGNGKSVLPQKRSSDSSKDSPTNNKKTST